MTKQLELNVAPAKIFFETTHCFGKDELVARVERCGKQDGIILAEMRRANRAFSPSQLEYQLRNMGHHWPITSIRRSLTTLTARGLLVKLPTTIPGPYRDKEHQWQSL